MNQPPKDPERIADETARHLLERAAILDDAHVTLAQLREAAAEAGISEAAFDAAVAEWRDATRPTRAVAQWSVSADDLIRNVAAVFLGWMTVGAFAAVVRLTGMPWLVHKLTDPIGLAIGAMIAVKLKARPAAVLLGGLAVSQGAEFVMDLLSGAPAIHGFWPHIGLMVAGVAGVAIGVRGRRLPPSGSAATLGDDSSASRPVETPNADADRRFTDLLRLRHNSNLTSLQPG